MQFAHRCDNPLDIVPPSAIRAIHQASLEILQDTGIRLEHDESLDLFNDYGCRVDPQTKIVRLPPDLLEDCLRKVPKRFTLRARNPEHNIEFGRGYVHFAAGYGMQVLDPTTGERRPGTLKDATEAVLLCDALDGIANASTGIAHLADRPEHVNLEWRYATAMRFSEKIPSLAVLAGSQTWGLRMARAVGTDVLMVPSSASPLGWTREQIEAVRLAAEADLPVGLQSMASSGATAPATLAGTAVVMNAEVLAMTALVQLLNPGLGVMYSCFSMPMDMRTGSMAAGSVELGLMVALASQLSRYYGLGSMVYMPMSNSMLFDEQAGYEKAIQWLLAGTSGTNLIWGAGTTGAQTFWSTAQLIVDTEICGMVGRQLNGIEVTPQTLALDLIREIGHFPNTYLAERHTVEWWQREQYQPIVAYREQYEPWLEAGSKTVLERGHEVARELLQTHDHVPLEDHVDRELEELLEAASKARRGDP